MHDLFYCIDGVTADGPHTEREIHELIVAGVLNDSTPACIAGDKEWRTLGQLNIQFHEPPVPVIAAPEIIAPQDAANVDLSAIHQAGTDKEEEEVHDIQEHGLGKAQLIKAIRLDLEMLWKCKREALLSHIQNTKLDPRYETTRKEAKLIRDRVKDTMHIYWKKSKQYDKWVQELVWKDCDIRRKLRGETCDERYADAAKWLEEAKLLDEAGCYCFVDGKNYLYIGKAGDGNSTLGKRLHDHRRTVYFCEATHLRIIIPGNKLWIGKLERLLLLSYQTKYNDATPTLGNNAADNLLELVDREMLELLVD